ncbi:hypothetical protein IE077_003449, partial [Cardiosporidium cionae]
MKKCKGKAAKQEMCGGEKIIFLNLHLLDLIYSEGGCILVDSTREGKRFPDSLSKVVPIWCATINSFVFNSPFPSEDCLQTRFKEVWTTVYPLPLERWHESMWLPSWLSYSDVSRITEKLQNFVTTLSNVMDDSTARCIRTKLRKFLLPLWVCPSNETQAITFIQRLQEDFLLSFHFYFIICVCASSTDPSPPPSDFFYIQGAADDQEMWNSARLTPSLFWANMNALLHCQDDLQCIKKIEAYVAAHRNNQSTREPSASLDSETMDIYKQPLSSIGGSSTGVFVCDGATAHKILKNLYEKTLPIHPHSPGYPKFHLIIRVGRKLFSLENPEITDSMTEPFYTVYKEYDCTYSKRPKDGKLWSDLLNTVLTWIWQAHYDFFRKNGKEEYPSILIFAHHEDDFTCVQFVVCACLVLFFGTSHPLIAAERTLSTKSKEEQTSIFCPRSSSFSFFMKGFPREILPMKPALTKTDLHRVANTLQ